MLVEILILAIAGLVVLSIWDYYRQKSQSDQALHTLSVLANPFPSTTLNPTDPQLTALIPTIPTVNLNG